MQESTFLYIYLSTSVSLKQISRIRIITFKSIFSKTIKTLYQSALQKQSTKYFFTVYGYKTVHIHCLELK